VYTVSFIVVLMPPVRAPVFKWLELKNGLSFILARQRTSRTFDRQWVMLGRMWRHLSCW